MNKIIKSTLKFDLIQYKMIGLMKCFLNINKNNQN